MRNVYFLEGEFEATGVSRSGVSLLMGEIRKSEGAAYHRVVSPYPPEEGTNILHTLFVQAVCLLREVKTKKKRKSV